MVPFEAAVKLPASAAVIWKFNQDWGIHLRHGSLAWLYAEGHSPSLVVGRRLQFFAMWTSRKAECPHDLPATFPRVKDASECKAEASEMTCLPRPVWLSG